MNESKEPRLIRLPEVCKRIGLSRSSVYEKLKTDDSFPKAVKLGDFVTAFVESEVTAWIEQRIAESRKAAA